MGINRNSTPQDLEASRNSRVAARQLERQERFVALLRQAQAHYQSGNSQYLVNAVQDADTELQKFRASAGGRIVPRRRPSKPGPDPGVECTIYLDECGSHIIESNDGYEVFVLAAVIIPNDGYPRLDRQWNQCKVETFGSRSRRIHEPDVRRRMGSFWFSGDSERQTAAIRSLEDTLGALEFAAVVCIIHRPKYLKQIGSGALDNSLPSHPYLMALDFLMERIVMVLDRQFRCSRSRVIAEARGPAEDALLQAEFVRLLIDGTSYVSAQWFRQQLEPGIQFQTKDDNNAGLQIADLLARPCGDKVLSPSSTPDRWEVFRSKLCQGQETAHSILGMKIIPWGDEYVDIWKS